MIVIVWLVPGGHARVSYEGSCTGGSIFEKLTAAGWAFGFLGHAQLPLRKQIVRLRHVSDTIRASRTIGETSATVPLLVR
jgi:hypothetical protein